MEVIIGGVKYAPVVEETSRIGIAVSTRNRHDVLAKTLEHHKQFLPSGAFFIVVDDGSDIPVVAPEWVKVIRHEKSEGIVAVKNTSLQVLIDAGCEELFLWDDDAYPIAANWEVPYIASPEAHLSYQFLNPAVGKPLNDITVLYDDGKHVGYSGQRGVMLYYKKWVIDKVGGFDPIYERGMYEHVDLASRIHNAGYTTCAFADVVGSAKLIHSMDEYCEVARSVPLPERTQQVSRNVKIYNQRRNEQYAGWVPYRKARQAVLTVLLTTCPDPQRNNKLMDNNPALVEKWAKSIKGADRVLFADQLNAFAYGTLVKVPSVTTISPYFLRWIHIYHYLRDNPDITKVWCTDGTDVVMLREPWAEMEDGKIYVGSEHSTYANPWFNNVNHHSVLKDFIARNKDNQVINAGLIGGSRKDIMEICHKIFRLHWLLKCKQFWKEENVPNSDTDMAVFGLVLEEYKDRVVFGPKVNTVFKSEGIGREFAWFMHK